MFKMRELNSFEFYRSTKHFIAPENPANTTKGSLFATLCPSIESEFDHLNNLSNYIMLRNLSHYVVDKELIYPIHGNASRRVKVNMANIQEVRKAHSNFSNLSTMTDFVIYNGKKTKGNVLKSYNALYEVNLTLSDILNNPKDQRTPALKRVDVVDYLEYALNSHIDHPMFKAYPSKTLFIPINRWVELEDYRNADTFQSTNDNFIAMLYNELKKNPDKVGIFRNWTVVFTNYNEVMVLDINSLMNDSVARNTGNKVTNPQFHEHLKKFMSKCKSSKTELSLDVAEDGINHNLNEIEVTSMAQHEVEKMFEKRNLDLTNVDSDKVEELVSIVKEEIKSSGSSTSIEKEMKIAEKVQSSDIVDDLLQARLTGKSMESYQRNKMLKEKYVKNSIKTVSGGTFVIEDILKTEDANIPLTAIPPRVISPTLKNIRAHNFEKAYNDNLFYKDLVAILSHFATCTPALYMVSDIEEEDISDSLNRLVRYRVTFEDENRKRHNLKFLLPKFYQDRYLFLNGSKKDLAHQKIPFPITKINKGIVQLSSSYNKIFTSRKGTKVSPKISRLLKILFEKQYDHIRVYRGDASDTTKGIMTTLEFDELASKLYRVDIGDWQIFTNIIQGNFAVGFHPETPQGIVYYIPLAVNRKTKDKVYLDSRTNDVINSKNEKLGQLSDFIIDLMAERVPQIIDDFKDLTVGNKFIYSEAMLMAHKIPVILAASCVAKGGLKEILSRANINYRFSEKREQIDKNNQEIIAFNDGYLIYDRYPYENSILLNGLSVVPTREYDFHEMDYRETYIDIFDTLYDKRNLIEGIENFRQLFVDPITRNVQEMIKSVTDFIGFLLMSNDLLADNEYKSDISYNQSRCRSNEIVMVHLYQLLAAQFGRIRLNPSLKFTIPEDAVIKELLKSQIVDEHSGLNIALEMETDRRITMKGPIGLNVDEAYTLEKRAFHDTMSGIVGMSTAPSGSVGLMRYMTHGVKLLNARGFIDEDQSDLDGYMLQTPAELLNTWSVESSDAQRAAMATNQAKQMMPTVKNNAPIITHDMERVAPYLSSDFAAKALSDGKVVEIENDLLIIQYDNGTCGDFDLGRQTIKHTNGGKYTVNQMVTDLKVGDKVKSNQIVAYNPKHITNNDIFGELVSSSGAMLTVAFKSDGSTYEDSTWFSETAAEALSTYLTKKVDVVVGKYANIKYIAPIGTKIKSNEPLLVFDDAGDEFTSKILAAVNTAEETTSDHISHSNVYSKYSGEVVAVNIYYTVDEEELTPSLRKEINKINKGGKDKEKTLVKYISTKESNTILNPTSKTMTDSAGRVKGVKIEDGVYIEFYIEVLDVMGTGDKLTYTSAVKGIVNLTIEDRLRGYHIGDPDDKIDCYISTVGVYKRMAHDINKLAASNQIGYGYKSNMAKKYRHRL